MTVNNLPAGYQKTCTSILNDRDEVVVARNITLLLLALFLDLKEAPEAMLHVWYSARLTTKIAEMLHDKIKPIIADISGKIEQENDTINLSKTWSSGGCFGICMPSQVPVDVSPEDT